MTVEEAANVVRSMRAELDAKINTKHAPHMRLGDKQFYQRQITALDTLVVATLELTDAR